MERKQDYTSEFRAEAVKVVLTQGLSLAEFEATAPNGVWHKDITYISTGEGLLRISAYNSGLLETQVSTIARTPQSLVSSYRDASC